MRPSTNVARADEALRALQEATKNARRKRTCLGLWSLFVRERDAHRCVACESTDGVSAHHIVRRTTFPGAELATGNGIALCSGCHGLVHATWNGSPRCGEPLNARGGDDQDTIASLFLELADDAVRGGLIRDDYYHLSDETLNLFKSYQGFPHDVRLAGLRVRQAYAIWRGAPVGFYERLGQLAIDALEIDDAWASLDHIHCGLSGRLIH